MPAVSPPPEVIDRVRRACPGCWVFFLGSLRSVVVREPVEVTSWWRSVAENDRVGGSPVSQHLFATALDLDGPGARDVAEQLRAKGWRWISEGDHEHVQMFGHNPFIARA